MISIVIVVVREGVMDLVLQDSVWNMEGVYICGMNRILLKIQDVQGLEFRIMKSFICFFVFYIKKFSQRI